MSKLTCLFVCVVAVFGGVYAGLSEESKTAYHEALKPIVQECSEAHGVPIEDVKAAKEAGTSAGLKPCFLGCVLKKSKIINDQGLYDYDSGIEGIKKIVKNEEDLAKVEDYGKKCLSVNDEAVTDGAEGCERAKLLLACIRQLKGESPV